MTLEIHIIVNNRPESLQRLLNSLTKQPFTYNVPLTFHLEADQVETIQTILRDFRWRHGCVTVQARLIKGGLISAVVETWQPVNPTQTDYALLLEDDIVLSPVAATWLEAMIPSCALDATCAGVSLYTPRVNELKTGKPIITQALLDLPGNVYRQQLPCSWGAAYKASQWIMFRKWMAARVHNTSRYHLPVSIGRMLGWNKSWKKFFTELILLQDWHVVYPNFVEQQSLSTNMLEFGEHIVTRTGEYSTERFTVPLVSSLPLLRDSGVLFDSLYNQIYPVNNDHWHTRTTTWPRHRQPCENHDPWLHHTLMHISNRRELLTLVISHMWSVARWPLLMKTLQHYCAMQVVSRIVVVWHSAKMAIPTIRQCGNRSVYVHFTRGSEKDTLMNRFGPSELIMTDAVATLDDDILIAEVDVVGMHQIWRQHTQRVVGPFARWYDNNKHYTWKRDKAAFAGYPFILTKFHISATELYRRVYCDTGYADMRDYVAEMMNAEDLLYMRVAVDTFGGAPALVYRTAEPMVDLAATRVGLHSRKLHNTHRHRALMEFGLLDLPMWATDQANASGVMPYVATVEHVRNLAGLDEYLAFSEK